jgi:putative SOS response-associated peptidase YedK
MCGRAGMFWEEEDIQHEYRDYSYNFQGYQPSYNVAPTRVQPVLTHGHHLETMKWGMHFSFTTSLLINARDDKLLIDRSCWTSLKKHDRCVVLANGFYEWKKEKGVKVPHYVSRSDGKLLLMAGVYRKGSGGEKEYVIATTRPSSFLTFLHDRMPVIFESLKEAERWIDGKEWSTHHAKLLKPLEEGLDWYFLLRVKLV